MNEPICQKCQDTGGVWFEENGEMKGYACDCYKGKKLMFWNDKILKLLEKKKAEGDYPT